MRIMMLIPAAVLAAGLLIGCQTDEPSPAAPTDPQTETDRPEASEAVLTGEIKSALLADTEVGALMIDVDTVDGKVYLVGVVDTEEQRARAENIARDRAPDHYTIENHLEIRPPETR